MTSRSEQTISTSLRTILAGIPIGTLIEDSAEFRDVLSGMEFFLPAVFREIHPEWRHEGFDGILPIVARKVADGEIEIMGHCILISDQTVVPINLCLQISPCVDEVSWLECRLGEVGERGMIRTPYNHKHFPGLPTATIDWAYNVTFGARRP